MPKYKIMTQHPLVASVDEIPEDVRAILNLIPDARVDIAGTYVDVFAQCSEEDSYGIPIYTQPLGTGEDALPLFYKWVREGMREGVAEDPPAKGGK